MASKRKRKPHHCKNHPRKVARGKCARCGQWVCRECALLRYGEFYCTDTCSPEAAAQKKAIEDRDLKRKSTEEKRPASPLLWATIALSFVALFAFLFALRAAQDNKRLRMQVAGLESDRSKAIELLREKVKRISRLKSMLAVLPDSSKQASVSKKERRYSPPARSSRHPQTGLPLNFTNGSTKKKLVALTFDGGSTANAAQEILDTLSARNVRVTMFLTGRFVRKNPALVKKFVSLNHEIGNHTHSHPHLTAWATDHTHTTLPGVTASFLCSELRRMKKAFTDIIGGNILPVWRAPYGEINSRLCRWAHDCGYVHIGWRQGRRWRDNLDSNDWVPDEETPGYHSPDEVYRKVMDLARSKPYGINGGIILMHLGTQRKDAQKQVHRILGKMIDDVRALGYTFVTVSQLLRESGHDLNVLQSQSAMKAQGSVEKHL